MKDSRMLFVNRAATNIFGYSIEEMLGSELTMLMPEYLRHLHRAGLKNYIDTGHRHISWEAVELPGRHKSGREISLELSFGEFQEDGRHYFTGIARDITRRKRDEHRLALQHAVTAILAEAPSLDDAAPLLLNAIATHLAWQLAALWKVDPEHHELHHVCVWRDVSSGTGVEFQEVSRDLRFPRGEGFQVRFGKLRNQFGLASLASISIRARRLPRAKTSIQRLVFLSSCARKCLA